MPATRYTIRFLCTSALLLCTAAPAARADPSQEAARSLVSTVLHHSRSALEDSNLSSTEADRLVDYIDTKRVARFTLGRHWRAFSDSERKQFEETFRTYAVEQLRSVLTGMEFGEAEFTNVAVHTSGDTILTTRLSSTHPSGETVRWRISGTEPHLVIDIEVKGLWIAIEQRAQFQAILDRNGGNVRALMREIGPQS